MKISIIKISGKALNELFTSDEWIKSIKELKQQYDGIVIVHGAGNSISEWSKALGHEAEFINGQRVTSEGIMDVVAAVQAGVLNTKIVSRLISSEMNAAGLTGIDYGLFVAENIHKELGFVGIPKLIGSTSWLMELLNKNIVPVFSSVCRDNNGNLMNVNADIFTEALASALKAESVFFISDVQGVKLNGGYKPSLNKREILKGIETGEITGGMVPKLRSCMDLLNKGINKIWIGSGMLDITNQTGGTWVVHNK
jgi:acetylglutamate kinase